MAVTAYLEAARVLRIGCSRATLRCSLSTACLLEAWDGDESLYHVIAYR